MGSTDPLIILVNSPGPLCENPITSGPCAGQSLTLTPPQPGFTFPNPLVLSTATARVTYIDAWYSDAAHTNMITICFNVTDGGVDTWYCYGSGIIYSNYWDSSTSSQELIGFKMGLPDSSGTTCQLTGLSIYQRPIRSCATETISTIDVSAFSNGNLNLVTGAAQTYTLSSTTTNGLNCTINYQITKTGPNPSLITLSGNTITFAASDILNHAGQYSVAVKAQISPQTTWSAATTATFNYINPCLTATMPTSGSCPATFSVERHQTQTSSTFALFQDSVTIAKNNGTIICAQTVNLYAYAAPSLIANQTMHSKFTYAATTPTSITGTQTISAAPSLFTEVGKYDLNVVACVAANPTSCKVLCSVEVQVTDPCLTTQITGPTEVQNFAVFAGQNQTSNSSYTFNDSISQLKTLPSDSMDFCGEKVFNFKINSGNTTLLSGNNTQNITFSPLYNSTIFSTLPAQILICMKDYSTNCKTINFNVTTLGFKAPIIPSQNYQINQTVLNIRVDPPFQLLPQNFKFESPLVSNLSAYILSQESIDISTIDLQSNKLTQIKDQKWINFDSTSQKFTVFSADNQFQGVWTILLVQSLNQFPEVNHFSAFKLTVTPFFAEKQSPYFEPALKNQIVNICPNQTQLWKFVIPTPIDPNNSTVSIKVSLNPIYFTYNNLTNTIYQNNQQKKPLKETISIFLENVLNVSATYSMKVEFNCKVEENQNVTTNLSLTISQNQTKRTNYPMAYIKTVDQDGLLRINFRQLMKIPDNIAEILNGTTTIDNKNYHNLLINVIPGRLSDKNLLNFTSKFVKFTQSELQIQLYFHNLQYVSFNSMYREQIEVQIYGSHLFADTHGNFMQPGVLLEPVYLPCLTSVSEYQQSQKFSDNAKKVMNSIMLASSASSFFISQPLQSLLGSIRHFQIIIHAMTLNLAYPATANVFSGMLMNLLTFQVVSFVDFFNQILSLDPNDIGNNPYTIQFNAMGYGAMYIVQNFGMLCFTIFMTPAIYVLVLLLHKKFPKDMEKLKLYWNRQMFYGSWITLINETYLFLSVCAMINCQYLKFDTYGNAINSLCAILCSIVITVFPFFFIIFYNLPKNYQKVLNSDEDFMARYGQVLKGLNFLRMGQKDTLYPFFSLLRKQWLVYVVVFMQDKPVFSLFSLIYQAIIMITLIGYIPPFKSHLENQIEQFNETCMLLVTYHLFTFTDFLSDAPTREQVGYSLVFTTLVCIIVNFGVVGQIMASISISQAKINYYKWRNARAQKSIQKERKQNKKKLTKETCLKIMSAKKQAHNQKAKKDLSTIAKGRYSKKQQTETFQQLQQYDHISIIDQQEQQRFEDVLVDYSYRDQYQSNQSQVWNQANYSNSRNDDAQIRNFNQNFNIVERQYVAAKPKNSNNPAIGEKILENLKLGPTEYFKTFSSKAEAQLFNQENGLNENYFYTNELGQEFQYKYPSIPNPIQKLNRNFAHTKLPEALRGLSQKYRQNFQQMFEEVPAHVKLDLCLLFCKMDGEKPPDFKEFQQCLNQVCLPFEGLYDYAMNWSKNNSVNAEFAKEKGIEFESAVDYRNGKIPILVRRCTEAQIKNDEYIRQGWYGQLPRLRNLAFDQVPIIEDIGFMNSVAGQVYWYNGLIQSQELRKYYPKLFELSQN